ncbi:transcription factor S-II-domain-containing protein [Armillaria novae-zelandiae]|uniref:DNA-directed RNA polymerase subunit n=1 Tax=Armillaria novae-zelandiae TaxID=153914 RepID=A0AA39NFS0_9AGAR|nr:transcription factor S-II-domain-containing protein [Armillaria novae-zelandiae]
MHVSCDQCGHQEPATSYENIQITTHSDPDAFPSALRQKRKTQTKHHEGRRQGHRRMSPVSEMCPNCGHMEAYSKELQLRSADEGSTVFYTCASCKHGWRVNN